MSYKHLVLCIMDGYGIRNESNGVIIVLLVDKVITSVFDVINTLETAQHTN